MKVSSVNLSVVVAAESPNTLKEGRLNPSPNTENLNDEAVGVVVVVVVAVVVEVVVVVVVVVSLDPNGDRLRKVKSNLGLAFSPCDDANMPISSSFDRCSAAFGWLEADLVDFLSLSLLIMSLVANIFEPSIDAKS